MQTKDLQPDLQPDSTNNIILKQHFLPVVHAAKRSFKLVWRYHQLLSGFLIKDNWPSVLRQSHLSANDKGDTGGCAEISWHFPYG